MDRVDFKKKVVDSAEVLAVLGSKQTAASGGDVEMADTESTEGYESLETLINSFYTCDYKSFFISLAEVEERFLSRDRVLAQHKPW